MFAPAKINLDLRVGSLGGDGFHPLISWMAAVSLFDKLEIELTDEPGFSLSCDDALLPTDGGNLVMRAAEAIKPQLPRLRGARMRLFKRIPSGAGLGGGSSDAAATLRGLNELAGGGLDAGQLARIGSKLGSDVPFFLYGSSSICQGRGERVVPLPLALFFHAVIFFPGIHLSTPLVYKRFDELGLGRKPLVSPDYGTWSGLGAGRLMPLLVNDLEPAAFSLNPELGALRNLLEQTLGQAIRMSGSGSSLFTLCENLRQAENISVLSADKCGIKSLVVYVAQAA